MILQREAGKESTCQCRRRKRWGFDSWFGKIPWKRAWPLTPVFLPGESLWPCTLQISQAESLISSCDCFLFWEGTMFQVKIFYKLNSYFQISLCVVLHNCNTERLHFQRLRPHNELYGMLYLFAVMHFLQPSWAVSLAHCCHGSHHSHTSNTPCLERVYGTIPFLQRQIMGLAVTSRASS